MSTTLAVHYQPAACFWATAETATTDLAAVTCQHCRTTNIFHWASRKAAIATPADVTEPCEVCAGEPIPGVLYGSTDNPMNSPEGIQRCDECQRYDGDLSAALALAQHLGGVVRFCAEQDDEEAEPRTYTSPDDLPEGWYIADCTDPWVEVGGAPYRAHP